MSKSNIIKFKRPRYFPRPTGVGEYTVKIGDLIAFQTEFQDGSHGTEYGRVMGLARADGLGNEYGKDEHLMVLVAGSNFGFGYERHVRVKDVLQVIEVGAFTAWFFYGEMPENPQQLLDMSKHGSLCNAYLADYMYPNEVGNRPKICPNWKEVWNEKLRKAG